MSDRKPEVIQARKRDGSVVRVVVPASRIDVEQQPDIPASTLALLAFSTVKDGVRRWSDFTRSTLLTLERSYGDAVLRSTLGALLDDIAGGFRPSNPVGLFIHRVRATANSTELSI